MEEQMQGREEDVAVPKMCRGQKVKIPVVRPTSHIKSTSLHLSSSQIIQKEEDEHPVFSFQGVCQKQRRSINELFRYSGHAESPRFYHIDLEMDDLLKQINEIKKTTIQIQSVSKRKHIAMRQQGRQISKHLLIKHQKGQNNPEVAYNKESNAQAKRSRRFSSISRPQTGRQKSPTNKSRYSSIKVTENSDNGIFLTNLNDADIKKTLYGAQTCRNSNAQILITQNNGKKIYQNHYKELARIKKLNYKIPGGVYSSYVANESFYKNHDKVRAIQIRLNMTSRLGQSRKSPIRLGGFKSNQQNILSASRRMIRNHGRSHSNYNHPVPETQNS